METKNMNETTGNTAVASPAQPPLLDCPCCGGRALMSINDACQGKYIECVKCGLSTVLHYDRCENLISSWNDRSTPWRPIETLKQDDFVVLVFSNDWKDPDFNPDGIREGFRDEDDNGPIVSAKWNGCHDCWDTEYDSKPTHWMPRPGAI